MFLLPAEENTSRSNLVDKPPREKLHHSRQWHFVNQKSWYPFVNTRRQISYPPSHFHEVASRLCIIRVVVDSERVNRHPIANINMHTSTYLVSSRNPIRQGYCHWIHCFEFVETSNYSSYSHFLTRFHQSRHWQDWDWTVLVACRLSLEEDHQYW